MAQNETVVDSLPIKYYHLVEIGKIKVYCNLSEITAETLWFQWKWKRLN